MKTKLEVGFLGSSTKRQPQAPQRTIYNFQHFAGLVTAKNLDNDLRNEVLKVARQYPEGSLDFMYNNIDNVIMQCAAALSARSQIPRVVPQPNTDEVAVTPIPIKKQQYTPIEQKKPLFDEQPVMATQPAQKTTPQTKQVSKQAPTQPQQLDISTLAGFALAYKDALPQEDYVAALKQHLMSHPPLNDENRGEDE